ncbi:hypothetical protein CSB66_0263 [Enterobacter hormaechei]|nr:hypothetical protein CSC35_2966 [Enterobacter hormaechei]RCG79487.1 hypothetical protein CSB66_0263 [Enterobacter hormaechei]
MFYARIWRRVTGSVVQGNISSTLAVVPVSYRDSTTTN